MLPPFFKDEPGLERSGLFLFLNTNKRSVTIDLEQPRRAATALLDLVRAREVLVENFSPARWTASASATRCCARQTRGSS